MRRICETCEGSGWVRRQSSEQWRECPTCRGAGLEGSEAADSQQGPRPPVDGEQSCGLNYHSGLGLWVYVASYSEINIARLRAQSLGEALDLAYGVRWLGDGSSDGSSDAPYERYVPGYYAVLIGDPRPMQLPIRTRTSERKEEA